MQRDEEGDVKVRLDCEEADDGRDDWAQMAPTESGHDSAFLVGGGGQQNSQSIRKKNKMFGITGRHWVSQRERIKLIE